MVTSRHETAVSELRARWCAITYCRTTLKYWLFAGITGAFFNSKVAGQ
jgi:hypothetical protein